MRILQKTPLLASTITLFLGILILSIPAITTAEEEIQITVSNLEFYWIDTVTHISYNNRIDVYMGFEYTAEEDVEIERISVDASDLNPIMDMGDIQPECEEREENYECEIRPTGEQHFHILANKNEFTINITFTTEDGRQVTKQLEHSFEVDNSNPTLTFIGTDKCHEGTCYYASGQENTIQIDIEDIGVGFEERMKVRFSVQTANALRFVSSCEGGTCYGTSSTTCQDGETVNIYFDRDYSSNDAGIPVRSGLEGGSFASRLRCDATPPRVDSVKAESAAGLDIMTLEDEIIITANITERISPKAEMKIIGGNIGADNVTVECNPTERTNEYRCTGNILPGIDTPGEYEIPLEFTDLAGNTVTETITVDLLRTADDEPPSFWEISRVTPSNPRLDKANMIYSRDLYAEIDFNPRQGSPRLVTASLSDNCVPVIDERTGNQGDISGVRVIHVNKEDNKVYIKFSLAENGVEGQRYEGMDRLEYDCPVRVTTQAGETYYSYPETLNATIRIDLRERGGLHRNIESEIERLQEEVDSKIRSIESIRSTSNRLTMMCNTFVGAETMMGALGGTLAAMETAAVATGPFDLGGLRLAADRLGSKTDVAHERLQDKGNIFVQVCKLFTCEPDYINQFDSLIDESNFGGLQTVTEYAGYDSPSAFMNPWRSEYVAYATMCVPAIVHHQEVRLSIDCNYLQCLSQSTGQMGVSPSVCQDQKQYAECTRMASNVLDLVPWTAVLRDMTGRLADIMSDPVSLFTSSGIATLCSTAEFPTKGICRAGAAVQSASELLTIVNAMHTPPISATDYCRSITERIDPRTMYWREVPGSPDIEPPTTHVQLESGRLECTGADCRLFDAQGNPSGTLLQDPQSHGLMHVYNVEGKRVGSVRTDGDTSDTGNLLVGETPLIAEASAAAYSEINNNRESLLQVYGDEYPEISRLYEASLNENLYNDIRELSKVESDIERLNRNIENMESGILAPYPHQEGDAEAQIESMRARVTELERERDNLADSFRQVYGDYMDLSEIDLTLSDDELRESLQEEILEKAEDMAEWDHYFGGARAAIRTFWGVGASVSQFNSLLRNVGVDFVRPFSPHSAFGNLAEQVRSVGAWEESMCRQNLLVDDVVGRSHVTNVMPSGVVRSGAFISGRKSVEVSVPDEDPYFEYWVSGGVSNPRADGLAFKVILRNPRESVDVTEELFNEEVIELNQGGSMSFAGSSTRTFISSEEYDHVCIDFGMTERHLRNYFDKAELVNGMLCSRIVGE